MEELRKEEESDPIPELEQLYGGTEYEIGRAKLIFMAQQKFAEEEAAAKEAAKRAALGYIEESETEEDTEEENSDEEKEEEEHLTSLTIGETVDDTNDDDEGQEEEEGDDQASNKSKGSKYSTKTGISLTSYDIEKRARKKRYQRAKEFQLKQSKELNDGASTTSTQVSGWGDIKYKIKTSGSEFKEAAEINPFSKVNCCHSTAPLWGRRVMSVSIGHNLCYAVTDMGEIIGWGGQNKLFDTTANDVVKDTVHVAGSGEIGGDNVEEEEQESEEKQKRAISHLTPRSALLKGYGLYNTKNGYPLGSNKERREKRQNFIMPRANETPSDAQIAKIRAIRSRGSMVSARSAQSILNFQSDDSRPNTADTAVTSDTMNTKNTAASNGLETLDPLGALGQHDWQNTVDEYNGPGLLKPLFPSWVGIGDHPEEEKAEIKICKNRHDYDERDSAVMKRVFRYYNIFEPPPSRGSQVQFLKNVLMPKIEINRVSSLLIEMFFISIRLTIFFFS